MRLGVTYIRNCEDFRGGLNPIAASSARTRSSAATTGVGLCQGVPDASSRGANLGRTEYVR
jgi:hypothetical protein